MSARRATKNIDAILARIEDLLELAHQPEIAELRAPGVSSWSIHRQIEHLALSDLAIVAGMEALVDGNQKSAGGGPSRSGWIVLLTGWIPRGKGRAPEQTVPEDKDLPSVVRNLEEAQRRFGDIEEHAALISASRATVRHPLLGSLNAGQWLRFARIHHDHHGKIIAEIRRSAS